MISNQKTSMMKEDAQMRKEKPYSALQQRRSGLTTGLWRSALLFVSISGLGFFFPSFNWLMNIMGTPQLARILHPFCRRE
jgi:formate dehydrogenase subunit gamma